MSTQLVVTLISATVGAASAVTVALVSGYFTRSGKQLDHQSSHETSLANVENALRGDLLRRLQSLEDRDLDKSNRIDVLLDTVRALKDELAMAQRAVHTLTEELAVARLRIGELMAQLQRVMPSAPDA